MGPPCAKCHLRSCLWGLCVPLIPNLKKTVFCAAFHNSYTYSMPFDPFSVWSEQDDITPRDNKSTRGQEVRLTPCDLWPYEISPQPYVCGSPGPTPPPDQRNTERPRTTAQTDPIQVPRIQLSCSVSHPGSSQPSARETPPRAGYAEWDCC